MRDIAKNIFAGTDPDHPACIDCGGIHDRACPRIARLALKLNADGAIIERDVSYWPNGQWEDGVIFPGDVYDEDDPGTSQ